MYIISCGTDIYCHKWGESRKSQVRSLQVILRTRPKSCEVPDFSLEALRHVGSGSNKQKYFSTQIYNFLGKKNAEQSLIANVSLVWLHYKSQMGKQVRRTLNNSKNKKTSAALYLLIWISVSPITLKLYPLLFKEHFNVTSVWYT